jgi:hypothetical protein
LASVEEIILAMVADLPAGKSLDPTTVAQAAAPEDPRWRRLLPHVRTTAVGLARQGRIVILRHNKPVDPELPLKGVYRLRLP